MKPLNARHQVNERSLGGSRHFWIVLGLVCITSGTTMGCRDSRQAGQGRDARNELDQELVESNANAVPTAASRSVDSVKAPALTTNFYPVPLDDFYQRQFVDYRPTESWAQVPRGETNFGGVPFLMFGKIDLTGLGRARDGEFQPARIGEIPVGRRATRIHLMHGAGYDAPDGTPVSCLLLRFEQGESRRLFVRYGVQVRNWYIEKSEVDASLADPRSQVVWNGYTRPDGLGTPTRLFKTTFDNPLPAQEIRSIELLSLFARANSAILAITIEEVPGAPRTPAVDEEDDSEFRREDFVRAIDDETGRIIPGASLRLSVTEQTRSYRFGGYRHEERGFRIDYPPGKFRMFRLDVRAPGYEAVTLEIKSEDGILGSDLPVGLKREVEP